MRLCLLLVFVVACSGGDEIVQSEEDLAGSKAPNVGFTGTWNKVGAFIDCDDAPLLYFSNGTKLVVGKSYPNGTTLAKGRPVLVQRAPGAHHSHVWVDADLYGMRGSGDQGARDDRFGKGKVTSSTIANMPEVQRRGWVRLSCLRAALSSNPLPTKAMAHPDGDAEPIATGKTLVKHVRPQCAISTSAEYKDSQGAHVSYHSYGSLDGSPIYLEYNTPSARTKDDRLGGGGMTWRYVADGEEFRVKAMIVDENVASNGKNDGKWAYGYVASDPSSWGWLYWNCLE